MASLIIGASVFIHEKVKDKKKAKEDAKRKEYEKRYQELEKEHKSVRPKSTNPFEDDKAGGQQNTDGTSVDDRGQRTSEDSRRSEDGPGRWVEEANLEKKRPLAEG